MPRFEEEMIEFYRFAERCISEGVPWIVALQQFVARRFVGRAEEGREFAATARQDQAMIDVLVAAEEDLPQAERERVIAICMRILDEELGED